MKTSAKRIISRSCVFYVLLSLFWLIIAAASNPEILPALNLLQEVYLLIFCAVISAATEIFNAEKIKLWLRYVIHFCISYADFIIIFRLLAKNLQKGRNTLIVSAAFVLIYIVFAVLYYIFCLKKHQKQNNTEYESML
ncbi:MAG: DUF3021 family protein [Clostridia bacterium]|nr:DUF3021 family protein [Clostridia bacterium]